MKQKFLEALKTKFVGVDAQILDRIATKKAEGLTDENQITSIIDGISFQDVLQSYGDFRAWDASSSAVKNYEKKFNLKDGKNIESPTPPPTPEPTPQPEGAPAWAQALLDQNRTLAERLDKFDQKSVLEQRMSAIMAKAKEYGIPESQVKRYSIPEDADLDEYFKDAKQDLSNLGFKDVKAPESHEIEVKKEGESIANAINAQTKEIVEQTKK